MNTKTIQEQICITVLYSCHCISAPVQVQMADRSLFSHGGGKFKQGGGSDSSSIEVLAEHTHPPLGCGMKRTQWLFSGSVPTRQLWGEKNP